MKKLLLVSATLFLLAGCGSSNAPVATPVPTEQKDPLLELLSEPTPTADYLLTKDAFLEKAKSENGILIDLRMPEEIKSLAKLDSNAQELDFLDAKKVSEYFKTADKNATYFLYDTTGSFAESTYRALKTPAYNFQKVYVLKGGIGNK